MSRSRIVVMAAGLLVIGAVAVSQNRAAEEKKAPTQEEMMAMMVKYATPGVEHERMKALAGTFDVAMTMQMSPDTPAMESKGKQVNEMMYDGRYLKGDFSGEFAGQPMKGTSILAFDKMKEKYVSVWIDSLGTGVMMAEGTADQAGKVITTSSTFDCPIAPSGKKTIKEVITIANADTHTVEMYDVDGGKEVKMMSAKYTRVK